VTLDPDMTSFAFIVGYIELSLCIVQKEIKLYHMLLKFFTALSQPKKFYVVFSFFMCLWLVSVGLNIKHGTDTKGISVSEDYTSLTCDVQIAIISADSASSLTKNTLEKRPANIREDVCFLNHNFDGTDSDRITLYSYSTRILEFWTVNRPDIAQYFYRKIITANEEDALSLHIKAEKLK
jgi:hypothetical protein